MLTFQPLPEWQDIFNLPNLSDSEVNNLLEIWHQPNEFFFWHSRSASALASVEKWWRYVNYDKPAVVWLPEYFCNQATLPLRQSGSHLVFYPIKENLSPDWKKCNELVREKRPDLFVLVHYFGTQNNVTKAHSFCKNEGAILIEDAAHILRPHKEIGIYGDFIFYSPHKTLAVPDGSILVVKPPRNQQNTNFLGLSGKTQSNYKLASWLGRRVFQKLLPEDLMRYKNKAGQSFKIDLIPSKAEKVAKPHKFSQKMFLNQVLNISKIEKKRKNNALALRKKYDTEDKNYRPFFSERQEGPGPYKFVLKCKNELVAEALYNQLQSRGIPIETWPDLPPEVISRPADFIMSRKLRYSLLFFPVHQSLSIDDLIARGLLI